MFDAAKVGNVEAIEAMLAAGADPNVQDSNGRTALFSAVYEGHDEAERILREASGER